MPLLHLSFKPENKANRPSDNILEKFLILSLPLSHTLTHTHTHTHTEMEKDDGIA